MARRKDGNVRHPSGLTVRSAKLSRARPFQWAWHQRVLMGYLNLQIGEEGIGKGNLTAWQAARISKGELPGDLMGERRKVVFVGDEDAWDHIWVPRLKAAGADLRQVTHIVSAGSKGEVDVRRDVAELRAYFKQERVALAYFDQLLDNLGAADSWKDKEIRHALTPLRRVAQETKCALLMSMHPNKRQGTFRERISGTPAFNALSRSSLLVAPHPEEQGRVVVVRPKGNYSAEPQAFEFRIEERALAVQERHIVTSRITDLRETTLSKDEVLDGQTNRRRTDSTAGQARGALSKMFADESTVLPAKQVLDRMIAEGFPERTTQKARAELGLLTWKDGYQGAQLWGYQAGKSKMRKRRRRQ